MPLRRMKHRQWKIDCVNMLDPFLNIIPILDPLHGNNPDFLKRRQNFGSALRI